MKVRFLGAHNIESRQFKMTTILVDDVLALDAGGLTSSLSWRSQQKLKAVLITHQHYDHIRDLPALAMNTFMHKGSVDVFSTRPVQKALTTYLFDGNLYPNFLEPRDGRVALAFTVIEPHQPRHVDRYTVEAVPVPHPVPSVGYQITSATGDVVFYTGDTGPGLFEAWRHVSPHLLVTEVTMSSRFDDLGRELGHLTPNLLRQELTTFRDLKGYVPRVIAVHMSPDLEADIVEELATLSEEMDADIAPAHEGMEVQLQTT